MSALASPNESPHVLSIAAGIASEAVAIAVSKRTLANISSEIRKQITRAVDHWRRKIQKQIIKEPKVLERVKQEVSRFLLNKNKLQLFVSFLEDDSKGDVQAATAGILANLPASDSKLTVVLIEYEALPTIIKVIVAH